MNEDYREKFFDLRRLIGLLLIIYGVLIAGYGLLYNPQTNSVKFNIDLVWGLLLLVIGVIFLLLSRREPLVDDEEEDDI